MVLINGLKDHDVYSLAAVYFVTRNTSLKQELTEGKSGVIFGILLQSEPKTRWTQLKKVNAVSGFFQISYSNLF